MRIRTVRVLPFVAIALWLAGVAGPELMGQQRADLILHNAKVLTVDGEFSIAEAVAVRSERLAVVGSNEQALALRGPDTKVMDLQGRMIVPGLIDTHLHINDEAETKYGMEIGYEGFMAYPIDWNGVRTTQDVLNQVKAHLDRYQFTKGEWIYFASRGGNEESVKIMVDGLNRWELDKVATDNPIVMGMTWPNVNGVVVNSLAMDILWDEQEDFFRTYGCYWVDQTGQPEGHLETPVLRFALEKLPEPDPALMAPIFKKYMEELSAGGLTSISTRLPSYAANAFDLLDQQGEMPVRLAYGLETFFGRMTLEGGLKEAGDQIGKGTDHFWIISAAPSAIDGSGSRVCSSQQRIGAASDLEAWWPSGQCLLDIEYRGPKGAPVRENYFREWVMTSARDGARMANTHAAGDRAIRLTLNLIEESRARDGEGSAQNWAMDHCRLVDPADLERAAKLGVMFSCDVSWGQHMEKAYGEKIANTYPSPFKSMLDHGIVVALESGDSEEFSVIEKVITRKDQNGKVCGPQERLSREEAMRVSTILPTTYILKENDLGSLEAGKLADLVVIDKDYLTIPEEEISEITPQLTIVGGKMVFAHPGFASEYSLSGPGLVVSTREDLIARRKPANFSRR